MDEFAIDLDKVLDEFEETEGIVLDTHYIVYCLFAIVPVYFFVYQVLVY